MINYPKQVTITEVGPRDGLQNEKGIVPSKEKIEFIESLVDAGVTRIEATSFVSPKWVPQMGDATEVYSKLKKQKGVKYIALVPNQKGMEKALESKVNAVAVFTAASETFTKKNINQSIEESILAFSEIIKQAKGQSLWVRGYVSTCFGCPYEGEIKSQAVVKVAQRLLNEGIDELSIGDTIGVATPKQVEKVLKALFEICPADKIGLHLHDTRGTALANVLRGLQMGITNFDSSVGGLGGCPYALGASGNLATEDLVYMLNGMGIDAGVDLDKLILASTKMAQILGRTLPSKYWQAAQAKHSQEYGDSSLTP